MISKLTCKRCGNSWWPRSETTPKTCPSCRSELWAVPKIGMQTCKRCSYSWRPKSEKLPEHCAGCNSQYWNQERVREWWGHKSASNCSTGEE